MYVYFITQHLQSSTPPECYQIISRYSKVNELVCKHVDDEIFIWFKDSILITTTDMTLTQLILSTSIATYSR